MYKKNLFAGTILRQNTKIFNVMKLISVFFIVFSFGMAANGYSQTQRFTIDKNNVTIAEIFSDIEEMSEFSFLYSTREIDATRQVSVHGTDVLITDILSSILDEKEIAYRISDKHIILYKKDSPIERTLIALQGIPITGTVTDAAGEPLPGVSIRIKGTTQGTATDSKGAFSLTIPSTNVMLEVSYVGYTKQEVAVGNSRSINIILIEDTRVLEEVVVVGYGTQKKVNLTGAVDVVGSEAFVNRSMSNSTQALQGVIPNLNITLSDGKPNRTAEFNVRGSTSIGQGGSALILIDGVEGDPIYLNPNDIESVTLLKDAASAAIYGARGAFGVVLITTKRPQKGRTTVNYTGNFSMQKRAREPEYVTDAVTWVEHFRMASVNFSNLVPTNMNNNTQFYSDEWLERLRAWKTSGTGPKTEILPNGNYEYYSNTDWLDIIYKDYTIVQDHNLSISGGNDKSDYYVSGRFYNNDGIYNYQADVYRTYNLKAKASYDVYKWLKISNNMEYIQTYNHQPFSEADGFNVTYYFKLYGYPSVPIYNPDDSFTRSGAFISGFFMDGDNYRDDTNNVFRNTMSFTTNFFDNKFRINGDYGLRFLSREFFYKQYSIPFKQNAYAEPQILGFPSGFMYKSLLQEMYTVSNLFAEYENTFAQQHWIKAMAGWSYETNARRSNTLYRDSFLVKSAKSLQLANGSLIGLSENIQRWRTVSTFFRLNYGYRDRYLVEMNGRYDGSSRFPTDQQWGFFPSVSGAWRLSEEPFWNVNKNLFSDVKFRASYGSLGNGNISPYSYLEILSIVMPASTQDPILNGAVQRKTSAPTPIPSGLTWEKVTTSDFGIDFGMLKGLLRFNGDYYIRKNSGMYTAGPTLPDVFGASAPRGNYADMTTKGFELTLTWQDKFTLAGKPFDYQIRGTLHDYVTKIDKFYNPTKLITNFYEGMTIGEIWGFETDGFFQTDPDPTNYVNTLVYSNTDRVWRAGDLKFRNRDNSADNAITRGQQTVDNPGDMTIIGNSQPRYQYSFNLSADWNGFFFSAFFQGVAKRDLFPTNQSVFWGQYQQPFYPMPAWHLDNYWTPDNPNTYWPRYAGSNSTVYELATDRYLLNVAFLRLKNLQIGYTLPKAWTAKINMKDAKIFLSGENLASWSPFYKIAKNYNDVADMYNYQDIDLWSGYDIGSGNAFPLLKTITLGISLTF